MADFQVQGSESVGTCGLCGRALKDYRTAPKGDPATDCGGDCLACMREIEDAHDETESTEILTVDEIQAEIERLEASNGPNWRSEILRRLLPVERRQW